MAGMNEGPAPTPYEAQVRRLQLLKAKSGADYVSEGGIGVGNAMLAGSPPTQAKKKAVMPTTRLKDVAP